MKKMFIFVFVMIVALSLTSAIERECTLNVSLLNQDPIHAVPGEYVKVLFQINGVENAACETVTFNLVPEYPFSLDPGVETSKTITAGTFTSTYNSQATIPFTLRVDKDALDDDYDLKVQYSSTKFGKSVIEKNFPISVEDVKTDFELGVEEYVLATNTITFSILNVGKNDVEALTVEAPKQANLDVKGSKRAIIGTLDANQDTTFDYEAIPQDGAINLLISYNDGNGERRSMERTVNYDSSYFTGRIRDVKTTSPMVYVGYALAVLVFIWIVKKLFFKKKKSNN